MGKTFLNLSPITSHPSSVTRSSTCGCKGVDEHLAFATIKSTGFRVCLIPHKPLASEDPSSLTENDWGRRWYRISSSITNGKSKNNVQTIKLGII